MSMKAAIYIRVSTREQVENYSIGSQKEKLQAYCKAKGWAIYDTYTDGGYSGATTDRPALQRMLSDLKNIDVVIVYKLDRLSRSQRDTLDLIEESFLKNNVEFVSITETLDTSTPFGKAMIGILSVFAQLERETIAERMRNGHIKRAEAGYRGMGGDYDPAGYSREHGELVIKPDEKEHIQAVYDLYEQYHSITKIQKRLNLLGYPVWRFQRYRDILSNKLYAGYVSFAGEHYKGIHEPIISEEQFERVQVLLERHKGHNAHKAKEALLSGLLTCGRCGQQFVSYSSNSGNNKGKKYRYYICKARRYPSEFPEKCMNENWNADKLERLILNELQEFTVDKSLKKSKTKQIDYNTLEKKVDNRIERVLDLYADGSIPKNMLDKQINKLNAEKEELLQKKKRDSIQDNSITQDELNDMVIDINNADFNTKQAVMQKLIRQITVRDGDVAVEWRF